jgi:glycosyltransferase involved in cell wall biosynthesis
LRGWAEGGGLTQARVVRSKAGDAKHSGRPVSIVMPAYNHARYVAAALDSVVAQTHGNLEIIVVDDGSTDATAAILDDYAARCTTHPITVVHQANAGAHEAFNHGLALARGEIVALMNSDDLYAPDRLEKVIAQMDERGAGLGFSATRFIDDAGQEIAATDPYAKQLRKAIAEAGRVPDPLYVLFYNNIAISTGNFVLRRELLERTGGFCAMRVCHDWDFLLAASYAAPITMVDEPLYVYRLHGTNTFARARLQAAFELEQLLTRFFSRIDEHPLLRDPARAAHFREHVQAMGFGGYLR